MPEQPAHEPTSEAQSPAARPSSASALDRAFLTRGPGAGELVLVRHGQQEWPSGRSPTRSEWTDPPLSETGRAQADAVAAALADEVVTTVLSSSLRRAHDTARAIAARHGLEPEVHPELREVEVYRDLPEGANVRDVVKDPVMRGVEERFVRERRWDVFPYTETGAELRKRVVTLIEGALALHEDENLVVVCHGGVINAWVGYVLGVHEDMVFRPGHASLSRVRFGDGRRVVHSLNETHHLADRNLVTS